jgi:hypothetical protein
MKIHAIPYFNHHAFRCSARLCGHFSAHRQKQYRRNQAEADPPENAKISPLGATDYL